MVLLTIVLNVGEVRQRTSPFEASSSLNLVLAEAGLLPDLPEAPVLQQGTVLKDNYHLVVVSVGGGGADRLILAIPPNQSQPALLALLTRVCYRV